MVGSTLQQAHNISPRNHVAFV